MKFNIRIKNTHIIKEGYFNRYATYSFDVDINFIRGDRLRQIRHTVMVVAVDKDNPAIVRKKDDILEDVISECKKKLAEHIEELDRFNVDAFDNCSFSVYEVGENE